MQALSDQTGRVYVMKLGGTGAPALGHLGTGQVASGSPTFDNPPAIAAGYPVSPGDCSDTSYTSAATCTTGGGSWTNNLDNSFFSDFIAIDYDLSFQTDVLYFGSVYDAVSGDHGLHKGAMHRLVIKDDPDPAHWRLNMFYDVQSPVTAAPSVASDGYRAWVYFGTGRLFSAKEDKAILSTSPPTQFLGLKERYDSDGDLDLTLPNGGLLFNATDVWVADGTGALSPTPLGAENFHTAATADLAATTFAALNLEMSEQSGDVDVYHGWKIELADGERVIGQPAILGDIVTFTSFIPSNDPCVPDGDSYLWVPYFRTGTAYFRSVIGLRNNAGTPEVLRRTGLGKGLATTPNIHTGEGEGSKAFVQSSSGAIIGIEQVNPGVVKSGMRSWRELNGSCDSCN
jgi:type IV pilus assembly protein PilY1